MWIRKRKWEEFRTVLRDNERQIDTLKQRVEHFDRMEQILKKRRLIGLVDGTDFPCRDPLSLEQAVTKIQMILDFLNVEVKSEPAKMFLAVKTGKKGGKS